MNLLNSKTKTILFTGCFAGTLDIILSIVVFANGDATGVLKFIASSAIGEAALQGGFEMVILGLVIHYTIAYCFVTGYFIVYPKVSLLHKSTIINAIFYGCFIWSFMHFLVLPLTHNPPAPIAFAHVSKNIAILILAIGLPTAAMAKKIHRV